MENENRENGWKCSCTKDAGFEICDKCRESAEAPGFEDIYINHFKEQARRIAEAEKHFGHIEGCEPLLSYAIDDTEFDIIDKAIKEGKLTPINDSRILQIGARGMNMRPQNGNPRTRVIIDIDPVFPYVLVRHIVNEKPLDKPQDSPPQSHDTNKQGES